MYFNENYIIKDLFKEKDLLIARYPVRINGNEVPLEAFAIVSEINTNNRMQDIFIQDIKSCAYHFLASSNKVLNPIVSELSTYIFRGLYKNERYGALKALD